MALNGANSFTGTVTVPNGANPTDILAYGQVPLPGSAGGPPLVVFRTADATPITSSATFANDTTLQWTAGAADRWVIQAYLTFTATDSTGAAATADVKTGWSVPASATMQHAMLGPTINTFNAYGNATTSVTTPQVVRTESQSSSASAQGGAATTWGLALVGFYVGGGTGGAVHLQWAQATSNAATLTLNKNSILLLWRVA